MRICQNCGTEVSDTAKFCRKCGCRLDTAPEEAPVRAQEAVTSDEIAAAEAAAAEEAAAEAAYEDTAAEMPAATEMQGAAEMSSGADQVKAADDFEYGYETGADQMKPVAAPEEFPGYDRNAEFEGDDYSWGPPTGGPADREQTMPPVYVRGSEQEDSDRKDSYTYKIDPPEWDHTDEFEAEDISENKVIAMAAYLLGAIGVIIALLAGQNSPYAAFHMRQALKFVVVEALLSIIGAVFCWTIVIPAAAIGLFIILGIIKIITFISVCKGRAVEPALIRSLRFLK